MRNVFLVSKKQATGVFLDKTACHFGSVSLFPNQITSSSLREMSEFYILKKLFVLYWSIANNNTVRVSGGQ